MEFRLESLSIWEVRNSQSTRTESSCHSVSDFGSAIYIVWEVKGRPFTLLLVGGLTELILIPT